MSVHGNQASARGDHLETLNGLTDTQLGFNYYLENANVVLNLGLNLPTGKNKLSLTEFETSSLISNNIFNLQIPNFGQGLNVTSGLTWALPVSEVLVLGVGASYQYKRGFKPLQAFIENYDPGDEILLTGGFDLRLGQTASFSGDVIFTIFGKDKIGEDEVFAPGNKLVLNVQVRKYFNFNELWLFTRYRSRSKNQQAFVLGEELMPEEQKINPNQLEIMGHYRIRFSRNFYLSILAEGRIYEKTLDTFSGISLFGGGVTPEIIPTTKYKIPIRFKYHTGSFKDGTNISGWEMGLGMVVNF
ncbi:MAG: hypothetical protein ACE5HX_07255 [bacterium]